MQIYFSFIGENIYINVDGGWGDVKILKNANCGYFYNSRFRGNFYNLLPFYIFQSFFNEMFSTVKNLLLEAYW